MAAPNNGPPGGEHGFPPMDHRFRDMRDKMNRDREAFFKEPSGVGATGSPSTLFGRESPFFASSRSRPGFEEFRSSKPFQSMGFPSESTMDPRKYSAPPPPTDSSSESIPIRVIHEKPKSYSHHSRTAEMPQPPPPPSHSPLHPSQNSPRLPRAQSEPPKTFNQRILKTKIPLGNVSEQNEHNLSTSASDSAVPQTESPKGAKSSSHEQPEQQQQVRHIPIRVEGRDEPVINVRKPSDFYPSNVKVAERGQEEEKRRPSHHPPTTLKVNNNEKMNKAEPTSPLSPIPSDQPIPMGYTETDSSTSNAKVNEEPTSPQPMPAGPIPLPCSTNYMAPPTATSQETTAKAPPTVSNPDDPCLAKLAKIQANVDDLAKQLQVFQGDKESKEYRFLDEMLTRNLLALDGIDTAGRDDVRQGRRESIKSINRCLSILESKAKNQAAANNEILSDLAHASK